MSPRNPDPDAPCQVPAASEELFSALANETRIAVLFALAEAERDVGSPAPFSEVYRRVDLRDSGKFNYHLKALCGNFVRRSEDGYALQYVGRQVYRAIKAGRFRGDYDVAPETIDSRCRNCDARLVASYDGGRFTVACDDCDSPWAMVDLPPGVVMDRDVEAVVRTADRRMRRSMALAADGICPNCSGRMTASLTDRADGLPTRISVDHFCEHCEQLILTTSIGELLLSHPAVVAFCYDRGVDVSDRPFWEIEFCASDDAVSVRSEDPWRATLEVLAGDEVLALTLDDAFDPVETDVRADAGP